MRAVPGWRAGQPAWVHLSRNARGACLGMSLEIVRVPACCATHDQQLAGRCCCCCNYTHAHRASRTCHRFEDSQSLVEKLRKLVPGSVLLLLPVLIDGAGTNHTTRRAIARNGERNGIADELLALSLRHIRSVVRITVARDVRRSRTWQDGSMSDGMGKLRQGCIHSHVNRRHAAIRKHLPERTAAPPCHHLEELSTPNLCCACPTCQVPKQRMNL